MNLLWFFCLSLLFITFNLGNGELASVEVDSFGETPETDSSKSVTFVNNFSQETLDLYWSGPTEKVHIVEIPPLQARSINSFVGHNFFATSRESKNQRVFPYTVTIQQGKSAYEFGQAPPPAMSGRLHPSVKLLHSGTTAMMVKFRCLAPGMDLYYDDGRGGSFQGHLDQGKESTTNAYQGHVFFFTETGRKDKEIVRITVNKDQTFYPIYHPSIAPPAELLRWTEEEVTFSEEYKNRTGIHWRHYYGPLTNGPRPPPMLHMWPVSQVGQQHTVSLLPGAEYWHCSDSSNPSCHPPASVSSPLSLTLEAISIQPRAFVIENFASEFEVSEIVNIARNRVKESTVGNKDGGGARSSDTRTSRNTWITRSHSPLIESLSLRAASVLGIDESLLISSKNVEDMQVVNYQVGQKYDAHHDWGVSNYPQSRFCTLLIYLTDMPNPTAGGETSFPKADSGRGIKVHPGKGNAVLFYNLLEDGNGDDLALHAALPVREGEKWLANFWVWDPRRKDD